MFSIDEVEESERGEERPAPMSLNASIMSTVTEDAVGERGANEEGREDFDICSDDACLLSPRPDRSVFLPPPRLMGMSGVSGVQGTSMGGGKQPHWPQARVGGVGGGPQQRQQTARIFWKPEREQRGAEVGVAARWRMATGGQNQSQQSQRQRHGAQQRAQPQYEVLHEEGRGTTRHENGDSQSQRGRPVGNPGRIGATHQETMRAKRRKEGPNHNWSTRTEEPQKGPT